MFSFREVCYEKNSQICPYQFTDLFDLQTVRRPEQLPNRSLRITTGEAYATTGGYGSYQNVADLLVRLLS